MAINDAEIENLPRGDMSDTDDFNNDVDDHNEEQFITQHIAEITEYIDLNNAEMDNLTIMYKRHCKQLNIIKHDSLLVFKINIALGLLKAGKYKINTRNSFLTPPSKNRYKRLNAPVPDVRFDGYQHWPELSEDKKRCKFCVQLYSRTKYSICNVALCFNYSQNCFKSYHKKYVIITID